MRICVVTSCFPPSVGGIERCTFELSTRFARAGHKVTIVTSSRGLPRRTYNDFVDGVGRVIRYPEGLTLLEVPAVPQIPARLLFDGKYDTVHIHGMTPTQTDLSLLFSRTRAKKTIYTHHFDPQTRGARLMQLYSFVARNSLKNADTIVATTWSYATSSPVLRPFLRKVCIVPMGVDVKRFDGRVAPPSIAETVNELLAFENRILFVGKLIYYKGLEYLLNAFSKLETKETCLIIIGDGPEKAGLKSLAKRLGISNRSFFLGLIPDLLLPSAYALADVLVLPSISRREAFGMVLLEAMASGKPVVASAIPGVSEVVDHGRTGYLVQPRDHEKLAYAIDKLLQDPAKAARMGQEARIIAKGRYDWERIYSSYINLYEGRSDFFQHKDTDSTLESQQEETNGLHDSQLALTSRVLRRDSRLPETSDS